MRLIHVFAEAPDGAKIFKENGTSQIVFGDYIAERQRNGISDKSYHRNKKYQSH